MLKILDPGLFTSIQDLGRLGKANYGVPVSGCMDMYSGIFANLILGNKPEMAVMEITLKGPKLQFLESTFIAITGADMDAKLNGRPLSLNKAIFIQKMDVLSFKYAKQGCRSYLSLKGGITTPVVLGSRSYYKGITKSYLVKKGDVLPFHKIDSDIIRKNANIKYDYSNLKSSNIDVLPGPEYHLLNENQKHQIWHSDFIVSKNNSRMAYTIETSLLNNLMPIITGPVLPGTVQLTPSGQLVVLMRDCQISGGYPRILQLFESSINVLSQKKQGNSIKFRLKD